MIFWKLLILLSSSLSKKNLLFIEYRWQWNRSLIQGRFGLVTLLRSHLHMPLRKRTHVRASVGPRIPFPPAKPTVTGPNQSPRHCRVAPPGGSPRKCVGMTSTSRPARPCGGIYAQSNPQFNTRGSRKKRETSLKGSRPLGGGRVGGGGNGRAELHAATAPPPPDLVSSPADPAICVDFKLWWTFLLSAAGASPLHLFRSCSSPSTWSRGRGAVSCVVCFR